MGNVYYSNCFLAMRYLQKIGKVDIIKKKNGHYFGRLRRSGRWCHFKAVNKNLPRWRQIFFSGYFEVLPRRQKDVLQSNERNKSTKSDS